MSSFPRSSFSSSVSAVRRTARSGFTIIELMVATAITLVVLGLMVQVTFSTLQTFDRVTGSLNSKTEAHRVLDYLRRDFSSLVWRRDGNVWLLATVQPNQTSNGGNGDTDISDPDWSPDWLLQGNTNANPKPGNTNASSSSSSLRLQKKDPAASAADRWQDLADYRFGQAGVWLRFFTSQTTSGSASTPAPIAVAYQIVRMKPQKNSTDREMRYLLFRSVVRPAPTATNTRSVAEFGYDLTDNSVNGYNRPTSANSGNLEPGGLRTPDRSLILANNVVDFGVRFWRRNPTTGQNVLLFPADSNGLPDNGAWGFAVTMDQPNAMTATGGSANTIPFGGNLSVADFNTSGEADVGFPDYAEVMVRILTDEGARLLAAYENGDTVAPTNGGAAPTQTEKDTYWWTLVEQHSVVYTDMIPLPARPL